MRIRGFVVVAGCLLAVSLFAQPKYSDWGPPVNLGPIVNSSPYQDFGPAVSKDGLSLYFSSDRPVGSYGTFDIWVSERASVDDPWGTPMNLGPIVNSAYSDNSPALSRDEHWLFFNSTRPLVYGGVQDIWASWRANTHDNFAWGPPFDLGPNINTEYLDTFPSYFENDGGAPQLFFASNRPGGIRGADIYVSTLMPTGDFGPPVLVRELSSPDGELRPSIRFDGLEIVFSRNPFGRNVLADLWASTRKSVAEPWSDPVNLGSVVNSPFQDSHPYIAPDRETLYFCSDRDHPGDLDLYVTTRTKIHP